MRRFEEIRKRIEIEEFDEGVFFTGKVKLHGEDGRHWYYVLFTRERGKDGRIAREHASVSRIIGTKLPGWTEMEELKEIIWQDEEECYQVHPKKSEYVNMVSSCLHIWRNVPESEAGADVW